MSLLPLDTSQLRYRVESSDGRTVPTAAPLLEPSVATYGASSVEVGETLRGAFGRLHVHRTGFSILGGGSVVNRAAGTVHGFLRFTQRAHRSPGYLRRVHACCRCLHQSQRSSTTYVPSASLSTLGMK